MTVSAATDQDRQRRWWPAGQVLALAVCRTAGDEGVPVDQVPIAHLLWWLGGSRAAGLWTAPLPDRETGPSWQLLQSSPDLVDDARSVVTWHLLADHAENRALADTDDGSPPPPLLLGDRARAVLSGPFRDGDLP